MSTPNPSSTPQLTKFEQFRQAIYDCALTGARDALFELLDALLLSPRARSFAELCLAAVFRRRWSSLYAALSDGALDLDWLEQFLAQQPPPTGTLVFALDSSVWPHPKARTLPERQRYPVAGKGPAIVAGHAYSLLGWVTQRGTSWVLPCSARRITPQETAVAVGAAQVNQLCAARKEQAPDQQVVVTADGGYGNHRFLGAVRQEPCVTVARLRKDRVLFGPPGEYCGRGRPKKHGQRFAFKDATTWGPPDEEMTVEDRRWGKVHLRRWNGLHAKEDADCALDVVLIESHQEREKPPSLLWVGCVNGASATVQEIWQWYDHRWGIEPSIAFRKQRLHWTLPRLQAAERCDRWTQLVMIGQWELYLARESVRDRALPWQKAQAEKTPGRVQEGLGAIIAAIGTPAQAPQRRGNASGWPLGRERKRPERHAVVRKGVKKSPPKNAKGEQPRQAA